MDHPLQTVLSAALMLALAVSAVAVQQVRGEVIAVEAGGQCLVNIGALDGVAAGMQARIFYRDADAGVNIYIALVEVISVEAQSCRARVLQKTETPRIGQALEWRSALRPTPRRSAGEWFEDGMTAFAAGDYQRAKEYFQRAKQIDPGLSSVMDAKIAECDTKLRERAAAEEQRKREELARAQREKELEAERTRLPVYRALANEHQAAGRDREANELWKKILAVLPDDAEALAGEKASQGSLAPAPRESTRGTMLIDLGRGAIVRLKFIPAGSFMMGASPGDQDAFSDEKPAHQVTISRDFWISETEVTQAQWRAVMGNNPAYYRGDERPVERVSWNDAVAFCEKLSSRTGQRYRLPTEAEWEYAARAGTSTRYYWGDTIDGTHAWFNANSVGGTRGVGLKKPNQWELYDISGNVWEWCSDWQGKYAFVAAIDPAGPQSGDSRVLRGGSWSNSDGTIRISFRLSNPPDYKDSFCGFRVVWEGN